MSADAHHPTSFPGVNVETWYRRYGESVYRRCLRMTRDAHQSWDLTQEVFLRAHRYRHTYRGDASPLAWLFGIANRCLFDFLRRRAQAAEEQVSQEEVAEFLRDENDGPEVAFVKHDLVVRLLRRAPSDVREIVLCRYFDELEHEQIAERLGVNEKTVRRKLERFLKNARKLGRRV